MREREKEKRIELKITPQHYENIQTNVVKQIVYCLQIEKCHDVLYSTLQYITIPKKSRASFNFSDSSMIVSLLYS